jgi:hypothetical protein
MFCVLSARTAFAQQADRPRRRVGDVDDAGLEIGFVQDHARISFRGRRYQSQLALAYGPLASRLRSGLVIATSLELSHFPTRRAGHVGVPRRHKIRVSVIV